jgi:hypothetical protein
MPTLQSMIDTVLLSFSSDPFALGMQIGIAALGAVAVYLLTFSVRDIILRTRSLPYQLACILLVAALPIVGFFLYLLVRPARTVKDRDIHRMLKELLAGERKIVHTMADHGFTARTVQTADKKKGNLLQEIKKTKAHASAA